MAETNNENTGQLTGLMVDLIEKTSATLALVKVLREDYKGFGAQLLGIERRVSAGEQVDAGQEAKITIMADELKTIRKEMKTMKAQVLRLVVINTIITWAAGVVVTLLIARTLSQLIGG